MERTNLADFAISIGSLAAFAVGSALVSVRELVRPEVTAVALTVVVVVAGRVGGRAAGVTAAIMSALCFDFFHTEPYLSLKITDATDVVVTILLLVVGLVAGGVLAPRLERTHGDRTGVNRILDAAKSTTPEDLETAVRAELLGLLKLEDCWFTADPVLLPVISSTGALVNTDLHYTPDGFELPRGGVAIEVAAYGRLDGYLVCSPTPGAGVDHAARQAAADLGSVLALVRRAA